MGQRNKGTKGQREKGIKAKKGQRDKGTKRTKKWLEEVGKLGTWEHGNLGAYLLSTLSIVSC